MHIELKPEQQAILERAISFGRTQEEVLDQAFASIRVEHEMDEWLLENRDEVHAQIEEGFAQSERGELFDAEEVFRILAEDALNVASREICQQRIAFRRVLCEI